MVQDNNNNDVDAKPRSMLPLSQRYNVHTIKQHRVTVFCAGCDADVNGMWELGTLLNAWEKVTGSRYMQVDPTPRLKLEALALGDSTAANKGTALEGWYVNTLHPACVPSP